jgi:hypothetical protein
LKRRFTKNEFVKKTATHQIYTKLLFAVLVFVPEATSPAHPVSCAGDVAEKSCCAAFSLPQKALKHRKIQKAVVLCLSGSK